jgi:hypothetical protein
MADELVNRIWCRRRWLQNEQILCKNHLRNSPELSAVRTKNVSEGGLRGIKACHLRAMLGRGLIVQGI